MTRLLRPARGRPRGRLLGRWSIACTFALLLAAPSPARSVGFKPEDLSMPPEESFVYDIKFLWFEEAARGRLWIRHLGGRRYRAELLAETKGLVGFLTLYRKNHYTSDMEYVPDRRRLLSRKYSKTVYRGTDVTRGTTFTDHERGEIRWETSENGELRDKGREPIPEGVTYEDLLSAFFNLRFGAYGPILPGKHLTLTTLPAYQFTKEGEAAYEKEFVRGFDIRIADAATEREYRERYDRTQEKGMLALVKVPKELFGQKTGEVRVWLDENLIPVSATVEDAIFFGDVTGTLRKAIVQRRFRSGAPKP